MKILFYISTIRGGGAARVMVNVANALSKFHEVIFITNFSAAHEYELVESATRFSIEQEESKQNAVCKNMNRIRYLRRIIKETKPDICISFMGENNFRLLLSTFGLKVKTIVSVRNDPNKEYESTLSKFIAKYLYRFANGIIFQTEDAKAFFNKRIQEKSRIIFNQVDPLFFYDNNNEGDYLIASGRLSSQKNYPMMLRAFKEVLKQFPNEQLFIFGEGKLLEKLQVFCSELGITNNVSFKGYSQSMAENYRHAKLLLLSSDYEGMPNAMLEALASSIPVISTDCPCGGPKMIIKDGVNGYLSPVNDSTHFATNICKGLLEIKSLKQGAYESAQKFRDSVIIKQWIDYLDEVVSKY